MPAPSAAAKKPHRIPERIGRYRIVRPLSKGGMALVYEGRRESLAGVSPRVAIKIILPDFATSEAFREMFVNEARLGAAMQHQNLVQIQDFDCEGDRYFLVMEYVEGITLSRAIGLAGRNDFRVPMGVICEIGRQVCDGLHYAHQAVDPSGRPLGLVHRDIKPSNLILNPQGIVKILDFGISKGGGSKRERAGSVKGTWGYMSPEQAMGQRIGPTADIFGLGIVLYELASRRPMFKGKQEAEIRRLLQDDHAVRMASTLDPHYGPLIEVLARALQRDPEARYPTAAELGRALSELLPDPITARESAVRYHHALDALAGGEQNVRRGPVVGGPRGGRHTEVISATAVGPGTVAFSVFAAITALLAAFYLGYTLFGVALRPGATEGTTLHLRPSTEHAAPLAAAESDDALPATVGVVPGAAHAGAPEHRAVRPPPQRSVHPIVLPPPAPGLVVVGATPEEAMAEPVAPIVADEGAWMTVACVQEAEIYVDGQLLRDGGSARRSYSPGDHLVSIVAPDGRKASFKVQLDEGQHLRRIWDFDKWEFR